VEELASVWLDSYRQKQLVESGRRLA